MAHLFGAMAAEYYDAVVKEVYECLARETGVLRLRGVLQKGGLLTPRALYGVLLTARHDENEALSRVTTLDLSGCDGISVSDIVLIVVDCVVACKELVLDPVWSVSEMARIRDLMGRIGVTVRMAVPRVKITVV